MANVKLLQYDGSEKIYTGVRKVLLGTSDGGTALYSEGQAVERVSIVPDFSQGDMAVEAPAGTLVKTAILKKPEDLIPGNIRRGTTVAGVTGELIGDTEEVTVDLDFASGEDPQVVSDMVINPSSEGKVISQVTIRKPDTLIPENIVKDVDIAGITGTLEIPESLENIPIALDFSGGDQVITAPDGMAVKSAIIQKPENLLSENIAEGVDIAGIVGTLAAGDGGASNVLMKSFVGTGAYTSPITLFTVDELNSIGFDFSKKCFVLMLSPTFGSGDSNRLLFSFTANFQIGKNVSYSYSYYSITARDLTNFSAAAQTTALSTKALSGNYANPYYANGEIKWCSNYKINGEMILVVGCFD